MHSRYFKFSKDLINHRNEKDYLLRHDKKYVNMAVQELNRITLLVESSSVSSEKKALLLSLLKNYRRDFLALVDQNNHIDRMTVEMQKAVSEITELVRENVATANQVMESMEREIRISSDEKERFMLWSVALVSTVFGSGPIICVVLPACSRPCYWSLSLSTPCFVVSPTFARLR